MGDGAAGLAGGGRTAVMRRMPVAFVSGPYRSPDVEWGVRRNIEAAAGVARALWGLGFAVICPHMNTAFFGGRDMIDDVWLAGDLELLARSDLIVMLPTWKDSGGARAEREFASGRNLPSFEWPADRDGIIDWRFAWRGPS